MRELHQYNSGFRKKKVRFLVRVFKIIKKRFDVRVLVSLAKNGSVLGSVFSVRKVAVHGFGSEARFVPQDFCRMVC